ncbi:MAG: shikimate kinase [SAR324 cluster bacterium]|nr:shikimate kinase [SAR324 cluster bacterium]
MNLVLIGFMGVGKTTIGRKLAKRLGYHFLDMDEQIEIEQKCSIPEIFAEQGEAYFRKLETKLLQQLVSVQNTVVATGGGVVTAKDNFELMKKIGTVIYLDTPVENIIDRVKRSQNRPLLQIENPEEKIHSLLEQRIPLYRQADQIIETDNLLPQRIISQIIRSL